MIQFLCTCQKQYGYVADHMIVCREMTSDIISINVL